MKKSAIWTILGSLLLTSFCLMNVQAATKPGTPVQLTFSKGNDSEASWSPDGTRIAFQSDRDGQMGIYILDLRNGKTTRLKTGLGYSQFPAWSPDSRYIVYSYAEPVTRTVLEGQVTSFNLYAVPVGGGSPKQLTSGRYLDYCPTFSPDGSAVYFTSTRDVPSGMEAMFLHKLDLSSGAVDIVSGTRSAVQASLSPNGEHFVFASTPEFTTTWGIYITNMKDPSSSRRITPQNTACYSPRWSPNDAVIACTSYRMGQDGWKVSLFKPNMLKKETIVTTGPGNCRNPSWSPDGRSLVYECNSTGKYKLYRIPVDYFTGKLESMEQNLNIFDIIEITDSDGNKRAASFAIDCDLSDDSSWSCVGTGKWLEIKLPRPEAITQVRVHSGYLANYAYPSKECSVKGYRVLYWDGTDWKEATSVDNAEPYNGQARSEFYSTVSFDPVTCEKIRIVITGSNDTRRRLSSPDREIVTPDKVETTIREIEIFGPHGCRVL